MARPDTTTTAPTPRITRTAAFCAALLFSVPVFAVLTLVELILL